MADKVVPLWEGCFQEIGYQGSDDTVRYLRSVYGIVGDLRVEESRSDNGIVEVVVYRADRADVPGTAELPT